MLDKRVLIIQAAIAVFAEKGFHSTKVEEVAIRAGVGKGTVYEYFGSKQEIFQEMLVYILDFYLNDLRDALRGLSDPRGRIGRIVSFNRDFLARHPEMAQILFSEIPPLAAEVRQWFMDKQRKWLAWFADLVNEGINSGVFRPVNTMVAAQVILSAIVSDVGTQVLAGNGTDAGYSAEDIVDVLFHGLISHSSR